MEIKIISFNAWQLPLWFVRDRDKRLGGLIEYIRNSRADIVCLQEIFDPKQREEIKKALSNEFHIDADNGNSRKIWYVKHFDAAGGLVIISIFPILASAFIPHNRFYNATLAEFFGRKGLLQATVETPVGSLDIINTHLHEESSWFVDTLIRAQQLKKICKHFDDTKKAVVFCGDFNEDDLLNKPMFFDTLKQAGFVNPTDQPLEATYRTDNEYCNGFFNRKPVSKRFDYIFVRQLEALNLQATDYRRELLSPCLSDHDPVSIVLSDC